MSTSVAIQVRKREIAHDIPGRFGEAALLELVEALDGTVDDGQSLGDALAATFRALPAQELAERLLDLVLLKPPIPAGCEALVNGMQDADHPPWRTHEIPEDRVWLWYCHRLLHDAMPETYPAPEVCHLVLEVTTLAPDVRPPGKRTGAHERTAFVANLLAGREGDNPLAVEHGAEEGWAFDAVWSVEVGDRSRTEPAVATALGATEEAAASGRLFTLLLDVWIPDTSAGDLAQGTSWTINAS